MNKPFAGSASVKLGTVELNAQSMHSDHWPAAASPFAVLDSGMMIEVPFTRDMIEDKGMATTLFALAEPDVQVRAFSNRNARMRPHPTGDNIALAVK